MLRKVLLTGLAFFMLVVILVVIKHIVNGEVISIESLFQDSAVVTLGVAIMLGLGGSLVYAMDKIWD